MRETNVKLCLLLEMLRTIKCMHFLYYFCDIACPRTHISTTCYSCDICKIILLFVLYCFVEK